MSSITLSELWIYPLKSGRGIRLSEARLSPTGLAWDRRWMLVDPDHRFVTQREVPAMARLEPIIDQAGDPEGPSDPTRLGFRFEGRELGKLADAQAWHPAEVVVWRSQVAALMAPAAVNAWLSECLGRPLRLVFMPGSSLRETNPDFAPGRRVSFADGYPYLLCNQASLERLNQALAARGEAEVGIERFRPNLVISGAAADAEDSWQRLQIGDIGFELVKPCERCVIITTDQQSGETGREPLRTLASYRKSDGKVIFGQNLVCEREQGQLSLGLPVTVLARKA